MSGCGNTNPNIHCRFYNCEDCKKLGYRYSKTANGDVLLIKEKINNETVCDERPYVKQNPDDLVKENSIDIETTPFDTVLTNSKLSLAYIAGYVDAIEEMPTEKQWKNIKDFIKMASVAFE